MTIQEFNTFEQTIIQALRVAGEQYAKDASEMHRAGEARLSQSFCNQSAQVLKLADRIEAEGVTK